MAMITFRDGNMGMVENRVVRATEGSWNKENGRERGRPEHDFAICSKVRPRLDTFSNSDLSHTYIPQSLSNPHQPAAATTPATMSDFPVPARHSDFKWPSYWTVRRNVDEVIRRYDSGEAIDDIVRDFEAQDRETRMQVEGILYEARPQRIIAILISDDHIEVGLLNPFDRSRVLEWRGRHFDPKTTWVGGGGGFIMGESTLG